MDVNTTETQQKNTELNDTITSFAKKGFLLDKDSLNFFLNLDSPTIAEEIINKIYLLTKSRIITKKIINEHFQEIRSSLLHVNKEKNLLVEDFFKSAMVVKVDAPKPPPKEEKAYSSDVKVLSSNIIPYRKIEVKDFVLHFKNRYNLFKEILMGRKELEGLISINKIGNNRNFSIIGLVLNKRVTKNKNIILEVEDMTGKINVLVSQNKENVVKAAKEVLLDDIIGIKCSGSGEFIYANDIFFPDSFIHEKKRASEECYAVFISDIHVGSKFFLKDNFERFIEWLNEKNIDEAMKSKVEKIKYLFVVGDNVDGVGIYPGQEALLSIKDLRDQYKQLAEYFKQIPDRIKIIMCPGQHDAVRVPEPQPPLDDEFAKELTEMSNVFLVSNPALIEVGCGSKKEGFKVLMYHGASMLRGWADEIEELRLEQAHNNPSKIVKFMLRHRHLSPTHSGNVYVPSEKEDMLAIKDLPDIVATGDLHKADVDLYNNILTVASSCWQSTTPFEEKVGNHPDPCKVPMVNLKTREIKILDFS